MPSIQFDWGARTYLMGIVNVSPDSFAGDGLQSAEEATKQAVRMVGEGADIIDVGGESTRPGSTPISVEEEIQRVIPVITAIRRVINVPISVDTYKYELASAALQAGADIINDIWGLKKEPRLADLAARYRAGMVLMSNQRDISPNHDVEFDDVVQVVKDDLCRATREAIHRGVPADRIIIDPGIGFGKTQPQNLILMRRLREFTTLGYPVLVGTSRKSVLGHVLQLPASERVEATAATVALAIERGVDIVRVHDVSLMWRVSRIADAIVRG
jgi:dihydropteroate synthase